MEESKIIQSTITIWTIDPIGRHSQGVPEDFVSGRNERFYPIPKEENVALYNRYLEATRQKYPGMIFLGRLGDYKYYDMDKAGPGRWMCVKGCFDRPYT